ncbi:MAG TPA: tetratricopeptide repeat protein [Candidatus Acidoferrum sp.]|nr:tetratricopeptide repeat protein [Candidatus Acidoferrum sp.]
MSLPFRHVFGLASLLLCLGAAAGQEPFVDLLKKGRAFAAAGDFAQAAESFENAIVRSPQCEECWTTWADFGLERFRNLGLQLRTTQKGTATVLRVRAEGLATGTDREHLLQRSALADGDQNGIWGELGAEQQQLGLREEAAATLKMARERQPQELWTLRLEARTAAAQGNWPEAERNLFSVGSRSPAVLRAELQAWPHNLVPPSNASGKIWNCRRQDSTGCIAAIRFPEPGELEQDKLFAEERWERLAAQPQSPSLGSQAWFWRGVAKAQLADCVEALPALERGLDAGAESAAFWIERCYASEAQRAAARLAALGHQATADRLRGDILVRISSDPASAIAQYLKAIRVEPREPGLLERLAQAYMAAGNMQQARLAAQKALALDPNRTLALRLLASLAMNDRDYAGALLPLEKLLALNPQNTWAAVYLGLAYAQTEKPEQALQYLQPALAAGYPDERGALHAALARALHKLGREQDAQRAAAEAERLADRFQGGVPSSLDDHP